MVKVYGKPQCVQCTATCRALNKSGIEYEYFDVTEDAEAMAAIEPLGYKQAPVVVTDTDHWSGFNPLKIAEL